MRELSFLRRVYDEPEACPYLADTTARMPLFVPDSRITGDQLDELLDAGYRRSGLFFYVTQCPGCRACEPLRVHIESFVPSRSQRRAWQRATQNLTMRVEDPIVDERRVALFNRHRRERGLAQSNDQISTADYRSFLIDSCCDVAELSIWRGDQLIAISIADIGTTSISAVYSFFEPDEARWSLGTAAIMFWIECAKSTQRQQVYLGMYVASNRHLNYKGRYRPHERLQEGHWNRFLDLSDSG